MFKWNLFTTSESLVFYYCEKTYLNSVSLSLSLSLSFYIDHRSEPHPYTKFEDGFGVRFPAEKYGSYILRGISSMGARLAVAVGMYDDCNTPYGGSMRKFYYFLY